MGKRKGFFKRTRDKMNRRSERKSNRRKDKVLDKETIETSPKETKQGHDYGAGFYNNRNVVSTHYGYTPPAPKVDPAKKLLLEKLMVGHCIEDIPEDCKKSIVYVMQGDGVYEVRRNKLGTFTNKVVKATIPGLKSEYEDKSWALNVPKIPATLLGTTVSFFRKVYEKFQSEVFLQFFYDLNEEKYILHCPKQIVGGASVNYVNDENFEDDSKVLVFEIHSHGNMGAFWSPTDDGDEKADRFYGVIGNISRAFPEMKLRLSVGGHTSDEEFNDLFDSDEEMFHVENYPKDWASNIREQKTQVTVYKGNNYQNRWNNNHYQNQNKWNTGYQRQLLNTAEDGDEVEDLVDRFNRNDHLTSENDIARDEEKVKGYWQTIGEKTWWVEDDEKQYYMVGNVKYFPEDTVDDSEITNDSNVIIDPTDYRGKKF
jgi:PRTRC genetic system protein A